MRYRRAFVLLPILAVLSGCAGVEKVPELLEPAAAVCDTAEVLRGSVSDFKAYNTFVYAETKELSFARSGCVEALYVTAGQAVAEGDLLVALDTTDIDDSIDSCKEQISDTSDKYEYDTKQLELDIEMAETELKQLTDEKLIADKKLDIAQLQQNLSYMEETSDSTLSRLRTELSDLQDKRSEYFLYSPISGTISAVYLSGPGEGISAYAKVIAVSDDSSLYLRYNGSQVLYNTVDEVKALYDGTEYPSALIPYTQVERTSILLSGGSAPARFTISDDLMPKVKLGDCVQLLVVDAKAEDVLYIPINSLYVISAAGGSGYVYRMVNGEKVYTEVSYDLTTSSYAVITSGLEEGDTVYVKQ